MWVGRLSRQAPCCEHTQLGWMLQELFPQKDLKNRQQDGVTAHSLLSSLSSCSRVFPQVSVASPKGRGLCRGGRIGVKAGKGLCSVAGGGRCWQVCPGLVQHAGAGEGGSEQKRKPEAAEDPTARFPGC